MISPSISPPPLVTGPRRRLRGAFPGAGDDAAGGARGLRGCSGAQRRGVAGEHGDGAGTADVQM